MKPNDYYTKPSAQGPVVAICVLVALIGLTFVSLFSPFFALLVIADVLALIVTAALSVEYAWKGEKSIARVLFGALGAVTGGLSMLIIGAVIVTVIRNSEPESRTHQEKLSAVQSRITACDLGQISGTGSQIELWYKNPYDAKGNFMWRTNVIDSSNLAAIRADIAAHSSVCEPVTDNFGAAGQTNSAATDY